MRELTRWRNAVFVTFAIIGFGFASLAARFPLARDILNVSIDEFGLILLGLSVGSVTGLTTASHVIAWLGSRRVTAGGAMLLAAGLAVAAWGVEGGSIPLTTVGFAVGGLATGITDVAMNLSAAANERALAKPLMPVFHALFSLGTVAGAGAGALAQAVGLGLATQATWFAALAWLVMPIVYRHLVEDESPEERVEARERLAVWGDRRTYLLGALVLGMALTEGSANDWMALLMVSGHGFSEVGGALALALFLTAMTLGRLAGVPLIERFGRVLMLRATGAVAAVGLLLVILVDNQPIALLGAALWGLGASLGFPIGMSAAADEPRLAAARVGAVATIGYLAFLSGPPLLGFLGEQWGLRPAMYVVLGFVVLSALASSSARERAQPAAAR